MLAPTLSHSLGGSIVGGGGSTSSSSDFNGGTITNNLTINQSSLTINGTLGTANDVLIISSGSKGTTAGVSGGVLLDVTNTDGMGMQIYNNGGPRTALGGLMNILNDNYFFNEPELYIKSISTGGGHGNIRMDSPNPNFEWVETDQTAPAGKFEDDVNNDARRFNSRNAANNSFQVRAIMSHEGTFGLGNGLALAISTTGGSITLSEVHNVVLASASPTNLTITLPQISGYSHLTNNSLNMGQVYTIKKVDYSTVTVTITPAAGDTIERGSTYVLGAQDEFVTLISSNANWVTASSNRPNTSPTMTISGNYTGSVGDSTVFGNCSALGGCIYTLPAANARTGQIITFTKTDTSSQPFQVTGAGSDLVSSTQSIVMYARGQALTVQNDGGTNWWPIGNLPYSHAYLGHQEEPNSAASVATSSNTQYCPFTVTEPAFVTGMRYSCAVTGNGKIDVGIVDRGGKLLASSGATTIAGTGLQTTNFATPIAINPGVYWGAIMLNNGAGGATPTTITRYGTGGSNLGCAVETGSTGAIPANPVLTTVGSAVRQFAFEILTAGGITQ